MTMNGHVSPPSAFRPALYILHGTSIDSRHPAKTTSNKRPIRIMGKKKRKIVDISCTRTNSLQDFAKEEMLI